MNSLSTILSNASSGASGASGGANIMIIIVYVVVFGAIIYFFMIRPQKKQQAKTQDMQKRIEPGDNIMTTSGFYGVVIDMPDDNVVIVEFGNNKNCRIPMRKTAITEVEKPETAVVEEKTEKKK